MSYIFRKSHCLLYRKLVVGTREEAGRNIRGYCNVLGQGQLCFRLRR